MQIWAKLFFHPNIIIYTPFESPLLPCLNQLYFEQKVQKKNV
jgi:hypothetical protein